jgi:uncharacterized protein (TIGR04141 family)
MNVSNVFDCIGYELALNEQPYILSSGVWYEVVFEFLKKTNNAASPLRRRRCPPGTAVKANPSTTFAVASFLSALRREEHHVWRQPIKV